MEWAANPVTDGRSSWWQPGSKREHYLLMWNTAKLQSPLGTAEGPVYSYPSYEPPAICGEPLCLSRLSCLCCIVVLFIITHFQ